MDQVRRALIVALALPVLVLVNGCVGGETDPPTNVTSSSLTANGKGWCAPEDKGKTGWYWWRVKPTWPADAPWMNQFDNATPFTCSDSTNHLLSKVLYSGGPYSKADGNIELAPETVYAIQLCGGVGAPFEQNAYSGCLDANRNVHADNDLSTAGSDTFTTKPFNVASDPAQSEPDDSEADEIQGRDSFTCAGGEVCVSGAGTGWACGHYRKHKGRFYYSTASGWYKAWNARVSGSYCWGTGKLRGQFKNYNSVQPTWDVTFSGWVVGWEAQGVEGSTGPEVLNGKLTFMRNIGFRQCIPPRYANPLPIIEAPCFGGPLNPGNPNNDNMKLKMTFWTDSNNVAHRQFTPTYVP
jgi:hypothetical protein